VSVWWQVGSNGGWNLASTSDAYTNWTASVILGAGTNIIYVYAADAAGNLSKTNSVKLIEHSTGFAPESIAGTMLQLATSNESAVLGFDGNSFSQVGSNGPPSGVGLYTYTLSDPDTAQLATTFTAPPTTVTNDSGEAFTLTFTNGTSGTWTSLDPNSGTFTLSDASGTAPDALSGLTLQGEDTGTNNYQFTNELGAGTLTTTDNNGTSSGTYTYAQYSPVAGLLQDIFTNGPDLGTTNYVLLSFLTDSDTFYAESDSTNGTNTSAGIFSVSGEPSTESVTVPESLSGLTAAVTKIGTNGARQSVMVSLGASTFAIFTTDTTHDSGVGTYTFTRTGVKTALFLNPFLAPSEDVGNAGVEPIPLYFTSSTSANFTNSDGHGTFTFSAPASTVPLSLVGRKLAGSSHGHSGGFSFTYGTFSGIGHDLGEGGTYTYAIYGPQAAMAILDDNGTTEYLELWFSSATGGNYREDDGLGNIETGPFTME
jgi:hypothetical protein